MSILLVSSGFSNKKIWNLFVDKVKEMGYKTAVIVTTAHPNKEKAVWAEETRRQIASLGLDVSFIDFELNEGKDITADVVYVCGGNTFRLLKGAVEMNFKKEVENLLKRGGMYIGSSAGSVLLSPTIAVAAEVSPDKNEVRLNDLTGLGLIEFHIIPHYSENDAQSVNAFRKRHTEDTEVLRDGEAIYITDNDITHISC